MVFFCPAQMIYYAQTKDPKIHLREMIGASTYSHISNVNATYWIRAQGGALPRNFFGRRDGQQHHRLHGK